MRGNQANRTALSSVRNAATVCILAAAAIVIARPVLALPMPTSEADATTTCLAVVVPSLPVTDPAFAQQEPMESLSPGASFVQADAAAATSVAESAPIAVPEPSTVATLLLGSLGGAIFWCRRYFDAMSARAG